MYSKKRQRTKTVNAKMPNCCDKFITLFKMSYDQTANDVNGQPPVLRYMDRIPMMKASASKRGCSELSPLEERSMEEAIQSALAAQMLNILAGIRAEVRNSVSAAINDAITKLKDEFAQKLTVQEER